MSFRFHVVGLPHTQTNKTYVACAYTQKVLNFCKMMVDLGHEVTHYGCEGSEVPCKHVDLLLKHEQLEFFGEYNPEILGNPSFNTDDAFWKVFNARAATEIKYRIQPRDFVCFIAGLACKPIYDQLPPGSMSVEYGIGYTGVFLPYRCYESYSAMQMQWAREERDANGRNYEVVVPNYYDPIDFPKGEGKGDYFLFVGRCIFRKGIQIAVEATKAIGKKLIIAGQGLTQTGDHKWTAQDGNIYEGSHIQYVGHVNVAQRAKLMGDATAILVPTIYIGPFEGVNVEAQMCGTPAIASDNGGFVDTVYHGKTGYRCRTLEQFCFACQNAHKLDRNFIRERALSKYTLKPVGKMYEEYFRMLTDLWTDKGWYNLSNLPNRTGIDLINDD